MTDTPEYNDDARGISIPKGAYVPFVLITMLSSLLSVLGSITVISWTVRRLRAPPNNGHGGSRHTSSTKPDVYQILLLCMSLTDCMTSVDMIWIHNH